MPVNFSAIGYGLCDEPGRRTAILDRIENLMQREDLFFWPLCFFSYAQDEAHPSVNWPFPKYENGVFSFSFMANYFDDFAIQSGTADGNWSEIARLTRTNFSGQIVDPNADGGSRFYRAVQVSP